MALCRLGECSLFVEGLFLSTHANHVFTQCVLEKECDWYPGSGIQSLYQMLDGASSFGVSLLPSCWIRRPKGSSSINMSLSAYSVSRK